MRLSEAIKHGSTLRPESHQERFCHVENRGLCSDAWGAACEAVQPAVGRFNWRDRNRFEHAMDALRAVQQHYFKSYWLMPAQCPGSQQRFVEMGGRIINRQGEVKTGDERWGDMGGITSECDRVTQMAGMVDHLFYAHGWSRERVAEAVEWYEEMRNTGLIVNTFTHFSSNQDKHVRTFLKSASNGGNT